LAGRGLTPHAARHTFATFYPGTDRDVQAILGHRTLRYRHTRDDRKRAAVEALDYGLRPTSRTSRVPGADSEAQAL